MKSVSIGYFRDDGDFAIIATINNKDDHIPNILFPEVVQNIVRTLSWTAGLELIYLEREDSPDYVQVEL